MSGSRRSPAEEPPADAGRHLSSWAEAPRDRGIAPAAGTPDEPGSLERPFERARVALAARGWGDARWSHLFRADTRYAAAQPRPGQLAAAARRMRIEAPPAPVHGPVLKPPRWTWEVPLYFWFGGMASGASFVALACDLAGDARSAAIARRVTLAAFLPCPPLLIADLGRPLRFIYMLRIVKPRSPMSTGSWCLSAFGTLISATVGADLLRRRRTARALGAATAVTGGYLGSYTGVLLGATTVPVWARSRLFLGPIFVATATATGAAATRLALVAAGLPNGHPTQAALAATETGAMLAELGLSAVNERRLGPPAKVLHGGMAGRLLRAAEAAVVAGVGLRALGRYARRHRGAAHHGASALYLAAGLAFRFAWVEAGRASAADDGSAAWTARQGTAGRTRRWPREADGAGGRD